MQSYWVYQRRDNGKWEGMIEEQRCELEDIDHELSNQSWVTGSLQLVEASSLASALLTVISAEEIIKRAFADVQQHGNEYAHQKWFGSQSSPTPKAYGEEDYDEDNGMNREASSLLAEYSKRL